MAIQFAALAAMAGEGQGIMTAMGGAKSSFNLLGRSATMLYDQFASLTEIPAKIGRWADALTQSGRNLSEFNGKLAGAFARFDIEQFKMNRAEAGAMAKDIQPLLQEVTTLKRELLPAKVALERLKLVVEVKILSLLNLVITGMEQLPWIGKLLSNIEDELKKGETSNTAASEFIKQVSEGKFSGWRNTPVGGFD